MPTPTSFDYAVVRVVPHVERGEFINAGVILFCRVRDFLAAEVELDRARLAVVAPEADPDEVQAHLDAIPRVCAGEPSAGPIGRLSRAERFQWLVSPRSTILQTSPVHSGVGDDPAETLAHLMRTMVRLPQRPGGGAG